MHQDYTKICRVCMSDGSRDIFHKPIATMADGATTTATTSGAPKTASPLERLLEKLRYVTMMKIEENDDLPRLLCDLCIVQLNVAYNFKRQAVENDTKLRQYFIENGISSNQPLLINEPASLRNSFASSTIPHQRFPIVPLIVKTEPSEVDAFSDATTETNVDLDKVTRFQPVTSSTTTSSPEDSIRRGDKSSSMVYVNSGYEFNSITPSSDIEFVQNYQSITARIHENGQRQPKTPLSAMNNNESRTGAIAATAPRRCSPSDRVIERRNKIIRNDKRKSATGDDISKVNKKKKKHQTELKNLSIDMVPELVQATVSKEHRRILGKTTRVRPSSNISSKATTNLSETITSSAPLIPANKIKISESPIPTKRSATNSQQSSLIQTPSAKKSVRTNGTKANLVRSSKSATPRSRSQPEKEANKLVLNPFTASKSTPSTGNKSKIIKTGVNRIKRKSTEKLLRPKIEPAAKKN